MKKATVIGGLLCLVIHRESNPADQPAVPKQ